MSDELAHCHTDNTATLYAALERIKELEADRAALAAVLADEHEISRLLFQDLSKNWTENDKKSSIFSHPENCPVCNLIDRIRGESAV